MRLLISALVALIILQFAAAPVLAQETARSALTLEDIHGTAAVQLERMPESRWLEGGDSYTTTEPSASTSGGLDIVEYGTNTGERTIRVDAKDLVPPGSEGAPLAFTRYEWSNDGRYLMLFVPAEQARGNNPVGDYWLLDLTSKSLRKLGREADPGSFLYAEFSPDSSRVAYVHGNNLYVEAVDRPGALQLTHDGSDLILNGRSDVVYEEEFGLGKAFAWSPDSRSIAYWRFDTEGVGTFYMIKNTDGVYSEVIPQQYPKPGTTNSAVRVGVVPVAGGDTVWFELEGDPRQHYVPRMSWAGNSSEVLIQHLNRKQNRNRVLLGDPNDGSTREILVEQDSAWVEVHDEPEWLRGGDYFTWMSERDGWRHLYLVSRDGERLDLRTPGDFDVVSVEAIDEEDGYVYYIAAPENVTQRYLYRARLSGEPAPERLTPEDAPGYHGYDIAPGARWAFHTVSDFGTPPVTDVVSLPEHRSARTMVDNAEMRAMVASTPRGEAEFFKVDIGKGVVLDGWMMRPPNFDPTRKYPLLVYVYSEPAGQTVVDRWSGDRYLWHLMLTQRGYLVASVDSRGAAAPRGRDWRKGIYGQVGIQASADQAAALKALMAERSYIDPERIGVWGSSGGGAMTLNALFRYPDLYSTGIALASPANQLLYNSIYQERYMGLPSENARGYHDGSPINFAQNLEGDLLIVHGTADDNVHYQNMEQLVDRLIASNKQFSMMAYPDRTHGISEKPNTRLHLYTLMTNFLGEHLPAGEAR